MRVAVLGGGITGLFAARYLRARGAEVTLYERTRMGAGSVHAAGILEGHNYYTINNLRYLRRAFRYLRNGSSQLRRVDRRWFLGYLRSFGRTIGPRDLERVAELGSHSLREYASLAQAADDFGFRIGGLTERYENPRLFRDALRNLQLRPEQERVEVTEDKGGGGSLHYPDMGWLDTERCIQRITRELSGVRTVLAEVNRVDVDGMVESPEGREPFDRVIVTTGIACRRLGLPITAVKGYGWTAPRVASLRNAVIYADWGLAAVPLTQSAKVTSGWDFTLSADSRRANVLWARARKLLGVPENVPMEQGYRPTTPDGLPLVGRRERLIVATGGFRLGWSLAPGLARNAVDLALDDATEDPFLSRYCGSLRGGNLRGAFPS